jgi:hypothetical protein
MRGIWLVYFAIGMLAVTVHCQTREPWSAHDSQSAYKPAGADTIGHNQKLIQDANQVKTGFFGSQAATISPFAEPYEYYRAWPARERKDGVIVDSQVDTIEYFGGGPPIEISALVCDPKRTVDLIKAASERLLRTSQYQIEYPGWSAIGFLFARKRTRGQILGKPTLFEDLHVALKVDANISDASGVVTIIYEVKAGPRENDTAGWEDRTDSALVFKHVDLLRWKIRNVIQTAFESYCGCIRGQASYSYDEAVVEVMKHLDASQKSALKASLARRK